MESIQDWEIENAEKLLLPEGQCFDETRRDIIRNLSSIDVQACPGSGKTTVLLAKLLILSQRQPFENGKGICVLTHTNVAINEIKDRLANKVGVLTQYPNFFGTFQSFVDTFLAIPASIHYLKRRPDWIDAQINKDRLISIYKQMPWRVEPKLKEWLYGVANRGIKRLTTVQKDINAQNLFCELRVDYENKKVIRDLDSGTVLLTLDSKIKAARDKCDLIIQLKNKVIKGGVLGFDEAYLIGLKYLSDYESILKTAFQNRFSHVFIDEMQDTDAHQSVIVDKLFKDSGVVIQKIGDMNQAIYRNVKSENLWHPSGLPINQSQRFHEQISAVIKNICVQPNNTLRGNDNNSFCPIPTIIVFDDPKKVLPKYAELIILHNLHGIEVKKGKKNVHKAIGWVKHNEKGELSLSTYWDKYLKETSSKRQYFNNLNEYLVFADITSTLFKQRIISILLRVLEISQNKDISGRGFSKSTLLTLLKNEFANEYQDLLCCISDWLLKVVNGNDVTDYIKDYIEKKFLTMFNPKGGLSELTKFLESSNPATIENNGGHLQPVNTFKFKDSNENTIEIDVGTIHSVKGETHTSTLYLETYYYDGHESERLMDFMKGNFNRNLLKKKRHVESLKMAYVGMSRPTHFLCVAIHKNRIDGHEEGLKQAGWSICDDLVN